MGVVRKQSILSGILIYAGFAVGAMNILFLFPRYFSPAELGLTRIVLDVALIFSTLCTLGAVPITLRFHPVYESRLPQGRNDLGFLTLALGVLGCLMLTVLLPAFKPLILRKFGAKSPLFVDHFDLVYPMSMSLVFFAILEAHAWSRHRTVLSNGLREFGFRLLTTLLILLFVSGAIGFEAFIRLYAWVYLPLVLLLLGVLLWKGGLSIRPGFSALTRRLRGRLVSFGGFLFGGALLAIIARTNDTIILASQSEKGLADAAVFTIATYLVTVMEVPQRSLVSIATPFIASAWKERDLGRINRLYQKTSLNLTVAGLAIFSVVMLNAGDAVRFLGPDYTALGMIVLVGGVAKLIDLATGLNAQILLLSKYWKMEFATNVFLVALSIPLNYWLTKRFNVMGPAYGNLIALTVFNAARFYLIRRLFGLQPFVRAHALALALCCAAFAIAARVPPTGRLTADVALRTGLFLALFGGAVLRFHVSTDLDEVFSTLRRRLGMGG